MSVAQLLLVRHGMIKANKLGHWHGSTDSALTRRGRRQVTTLAQKLRDRPVQAIYASPLQRCQATASGIARMITQDVITHPGLREWSIGDWEGTPYDTLTRDHDFFRMTSEDLHYAPPGGESVHQVSERIVESLRAIGSAHRGEVVVVSHGAALAVAVASLLDGDPTLWGNYSFANCSVTELVLEPTPVLSSYNVT